MILLNRAKVYLRRSRYERWASWETTSLVAVNASFLLDGVVYIFLLFPSLRLSNPLWLGPMKMVHEGRACTFKSSCGICTGRRRKEAGFLLISYLFSWRWLAVWAVFTTLICLFLAQLLGTSLIVCKLDVIFRLLLARVGAGAAELPFSLTRRAVVPLALSFIISALLLL